jgi:hypothetical protein
MFRAGSQLAEWARFIGIAGGETAVVSFACTSGFGGGGKSSNELPMLPTWSPVFAGMTSSSTTILAVIVRIRAGSSCYVKKPAKIFQKKITQKIPAHYF